jgi:acyl-CoA synthetase (AMP-forming)/AMP-acid ligase II
MDALLLDILHARAHHDKDRRVYTFLSDGETEAASLTYGELEHKALSISHYLSEVSRAGDRALLLYQPGVDFIIALFGCLYAGIVAVPAYPPRSNKLDARIDAIISDARPSAILTTSAYSERLRSLHLPVFATDTIQNGDSHTYVRSKHPIAWLQYTSGSTSSPRGVMVTHDNLMQNSACLRQAAQYSQDTVAVTWLPHFHDMGLVEALLQPVVQGFPVYFFPAAVFLQRPFTWLSLISRYRATHSGAPNFAYELCSKSVRAEQLTTLNLNTWSCAYVGAEPIHRKTLEAFYQRFSPCGFRWQALYPAYGMAETTLQIAGGIGGKGPHFFEVEKASLREHRIKAAVGHDMTSLVSCGYPLQDFTIAIVDPSAHTLCSTEEVGEIWVQGTSVAKGYWQRDDETQSVFNAYTAEGQGPYLRTGDLGCLIHGELYVTGRLKEMLIIRGRNHYPADLERTALSVVDGVRCCAAIHVEADRASLLVLLIETDRHLYKEFQEKLTAQHMSKVLMGLQKAVADGHDLSLDHVLFLSPGAIPKTSSGKTQRLLCKAQYLAGTLDPLWQWQKPEVPSAMRLEEVPL